MEALSGTRFETLGTHDHRQGGEARLILLFYVTSDFPL